MLYNASISPPAISFHARLVVRYTSCRRRRGADSPLITIASLSFGRISRSSDCLSQVSSSVVELFTHHYTTTSSSRPATTMPVPIVMCGKFAEPAAVFAKMMLPEYEGQLYIHIPELTTCRNRMLILTSGPPLHVGRRSHHLPPAGYGRHSRPQRLR